MENYFLFRLKYHLEMQIYFLSCSNFSKRNFLYHFLIILYFILFNNLFTLFLHIAIVKLTPSINSKVLVSKIFFYSRSLQSLKKLYFFILCHVFKSYLKILIISKILQDHRINNVKFLINIFKNFNIKYFLLKILKFLQLIQIHHYLNIIFNNLKDYL